MHATCSKEEAAAQHAAFVAEGLGCSSKLNREFWINDRNENEFGYNENPTARAALMAQAKIWLSERSAERIRLITGNK